jgi:hypothetical protein
MFRAFALLPLLAVLVSAQAFKLWLKDGAYQTVREYQVQSDRVRYYSVERGEWEEVPLDLIDLKRTEGERKVRADAEKKEVEATIAEDAYERELRREIALIPPDPGVYMVTGGQVRTFKQAEAKLANNKRRSILKAITPIPIVAGKGTLELDGEQSAEAVSDDRPNFYFRVVEDERYGIARMGAKKGVRVVETWNIIPITKEIMAERQDVDIFRQQVAPGLFKIWPTQPLAPGEYAVIEYTEGKGNTMVWDFRIVPKAP